MIDPDMTDTASAATHGKRSKQQDLAGGAASGPLSRALGCEGSNSDVDDLQLRAEIWPVYRKTLRELGIAGSDTIYLVDLLLPLAVFLGRRIDRCEGNCLIGLGGGPGAGKTTLSRLLARTLPIVCDGTLDCLSLSLDDFYLSRAERLRRGFKWRTLPGTHDTDQLSRFARDLDENQAPFAVPRYDLGLDQPIPDEMLPTAPRVCVFDGAMVGSRHNGYDGLARRLDIFIYLDAPAPLLKSWRFERERRLRVRSGGAAGFSPADMAAFWREALRPSIDRWVRPNADDADLVVTLGPERTVLGADYRPGAKARRDG